MKIGEMNGPWAMALRFMLATYPFIIGWGVFITNLTVENKYGLKVFMAAGDRFSLQDAYAMEQRIEAKLNELPPKDWREKIEHLGDEVNMLRTNMRSFENEFTRDFIRKNEIEKFIDNQ